MLQTRLLAAVALWCAWGRMSDAERRRARFEDYPAAGWSGVRAPVKLVTRSERMFRTRLSEAARLPPNFAGHYTFTVWGCGSSCAAAAFIDVETGNVLQPPHASGSGWGRWIFDCGMLTGAGFSYRVNSRLFVLRCGKTYVEKLEDIVPDTFYFVLEGERFRQIMRIPADQAAVETSK